MEADISSTSENKTLSVTISINENDDKEVMEGNRSDNLTRSVNIDNADSVTKHNTDSDTETRKVSHCGSDINEFKHDTNEIDLSPPTRTTNFSISEILKPTFGCKNKENSCVKGRHTDQAVLNRLYGPFQKNLDIIDKLSHLNQYFVNNIAANDFLKDTSGRSASPDSTSDSESTGKYQRIKSPNVSGSSESECRVSTPWPAWVYCTRYSDRPSAGKIFHNERDILWRQLA